ncbi:MAG: EAL domain-containing protein [Pseudomonadota bacterium]|nr:EAL domain-containing protein [Pseudomonadota bacterium]
MSTSSCTNQHWIEHLEDAGYGVWDWDLLTNQVTYSKKWKSMLGYAEDEIGNDFSEFQERVHQEDFPALLENVQLHLQGIKPVFVHEFRMLAKDGRYRWILAQGSVLDKDADGKPLRMVGIHTDITESKQALKDLKEQKNFIDKVVNSAPIFVYIFDLVSQQNIYCNDAVFTLLGYTAEEIQARDNKLVDISMFHPDDLPKLQAHFVELTGLPEGQTRIIEYQVRHKNGDYRTFRSYDTAFMRNEHNQVTQIIGTAEDVTQLKDSERQLEFLAHHDPLTNLPNRSLLHARLEHSLQINERLGTQLAVCFIDLDNFKYINDRYGHSIGDQVLIEVAQRMQARVRKEDSLARVGGDEFVLVLERLAGSKASEKVIVELLESFKEPIVLGEMSFTLSVSIGMSFFPQDGDSIEVLNKHADTAMYRAKMAGKNTFRVYSQSMSDDLVGRLELETDLKYALTQQQFELYYQPKVNLRDRKVIGLEALIRWNHPDKGLVPPNDFIPLAEELGLIVPMGEWVLNQACLDLQILKNRAGFKGSVAVNVSGVQLEQSDFLETIQSIFEQQPIHPQEVELEITESAIMNNPNRWIRLLKALQEMQFKISIDDFGTGYSSLSYLKKLPVNQLKIDKSFIDDVPHDEDDNAITSSIVSLAQAMKLETVAEGIETVEQLEFLTELGCHQAQGYLFSRPLPLDEMVVWLESVKDW